jgi:uncharacterized membrane protein YeaQ/YmgE (transglycosylase-associated protein family)
MEDPAVRRRLYFLLPDVPAAEQTLNDLLLARVEARHVHCLARRDTDLGELPEAGALQKTDFVHGAEVGLAIGGIAGVAVGALAIAFPPEGVTLQFVTVLLTGVLGAVFGAWVSSMAGAAIPNSRLAAFYRAIEAGSILMMVDVPLYRAQEIRDLVAKRHPEAVAGGVEPTIPAFP